MNNSDNNNQQIINWNDLLTVVESKKEINIFDVLLTKIFHHLKLFSKGGRCKIDGNVVLPNHQDRFDHYKLIYEKLLIEEDIVGIDYTINPINSSNPSNPSDCCMFTLVAFGTWIKLNAGNSSKLKIVDGESHFINDKSIASFVKKVNILRDQYRFFGNPPLIYYKFKNMPNQDVVDYFTDNNIIVQPIDTKCESIKINKELFTQSVILDKTAVAILCSNIYSDPKSSYFEEYKTSANNFISNKDLIVDNYVQDKKNLLTYINGKRIIMCQNYFDAIEGSYPFIAGPTEKIRFDELMARIEVVPDCHNMRFNRLNSSEQILASVAEREYATIITSNKVLSNKLNTHYPELPYQLHKSVQLVENTNIDDDNLNNGYRLVLKQLYCFLLILKIITLFVLLLLNNSLPAFSFIALLIYAFIVLIVIDVIVLNNKLD